MKVFSFIFALYFLGLATIPCCEREDCAEVKNSVTAYIHTGDNQDTQHKNEVCSPFCTCNCCGGVTIIPNSDKTIIAQQPSKQLSNFTQNFPSEIPFSIWQPPKV